MFHYWLRACYDEKPALSVLLEIMLAILAERLSFEYIKEKINRHDNLCVEPLCCSLMSLNLWSETHSMQTTCIFDKLGKHCALILLLVLNKTNSWIK